MDEDLNSGLIKTSTSDHDEITNYSWTILPSVNKNKTRQNMWPFFQPLNKR